MASVSTRSRLLISGIGPELDRLKALATKLRIETRVDFLGGEPPPNRLYGRSRVVVVPSMWPEPFGLVGPEAMSHGVPVIANRVGGIPEWLVDGEAGYLVKAGDTAGMASRIAELLEDSALAARLGRRARDIALDRFTPDLYFRRLNRLIEAVVAKAVPYQGLFTEAG
jgi:glycosyltransferase involved in cell wall biosynthesis